MSKTLLDLLNKTREDIAAKRGNNVDLTRLKTASTISASSRIKTTQTVSSSRLSVCTTLSIRTRKVKKQPTLIFVSNILTVALVSYAKWLWKVALVTRVTKQWKNASVKCVPLLATVNGILSAREDFADAEKCQLIELPSTVFDDICKAITEDIADDIGNPLSKEEGYAFLIKRTGSGRDTKYDVSPKRKVYKGDIEDKFWNTQHDLIAYANQADETRLLSTVRTMGRLIGIAAPTAAASAPAISSTAKTSAAALLDLALSLVIRRVRLL